MFDSEAPRKGSLPATDVQQFRAALKAVLDERDEHGRCWGDSPWGVYAFYDYDGEPIYVGQTNEKLRVRVQRHLTNQRTDAVAMRILDVFEVAEIELWPLWSLCNSPTSDPAARAQLNTVEYSAYLQAIERSRFQAILNEKIPPVSARGELPPSLRRPLISDAVRADRGHPDIRIARRAETISRLSAVARERGEVSEGLRRVLVIQAIRLAYLSAERLAYVTGRPAPSPGAISTEQLIGSVLAERPVPTDHSVPTEYSDRGDGFGPAEDWTEPEEVDAVSSFPDELALFDTLDFPAGPSES